MVLGILSLVTCLVPLGILAVIFGHISLSRIRKSAGEVQGAGMAIAGLVTGYIATLICLLAIGLMVVGFREEAKVRGDPDELFTLPVFEPGAFPAMGEGRLVEGSGVRLHDLGGASSLVGGKTKLRILVPAGEHAAASLPCVLVAPAGTNLLNGTELDDGFYLDEILPYAEAGMVVVLYSLDGPIDGDNEGEAYTAFRAASAGVANGTFAYECASMMIPQVDPARIYSAGHSSAGTLSLLLAAHLPDLAGSIAYAPACDVAALHADSVKSPFASLGFPGLAEFVKRSSPLTHAAKVKVPLYLFAAEDDEMLAPAELENYARKVEEAGGVVEVKMVPAGGHYQAMIDQGIPSGIEWIRRQK
jgi:dienelactone hydrolase